MRLGQCKSCWWWKTSTFAGYGRCYMHKGDGWPYTMVKAKSYCPDYVNRKKENSKSGTLNEFLNEPQQDSLPDFKEP